MDINPLVSVILPTYNRAAYIGNCIDSILAQTYTNVEIIVIDDSPDATRDAITSYLDNKKIIYIANSPKAGLQESRNMGIKTAKGELLFIVDDDLFLHPTCIDCMIKTYLSLSKTEKNFVVVPRMIEKLAFNEEAIRRNVVVYINPWTGELSCDYVTKRSGVPSIGMGHANCLYSTEAVRSVGGYIEKLYKGNYAYEDIDLNMRLLHKGYKFYFQSLADIDHNRSETGGCRVPGRFNQTYYYVRNYTAYLFSNFGMKAAYMFPCFLFILTRRIIVDNILTKRD